MNTPQLIYNVIFKEGIIAFIQRKRNITYLDSKTTFTINYRNKKTKIVLNRKFGFVDMRIFRDGIYEKEIVDDLFNELDKSKNLIDIGANIGQHSLLLAPYCKNVYSFEPIPAVYNQFKESIGLNHYQNIHLFNTAVGNKKETQPFNYVTNHAGTSSFVERDNPNPNIISVQIDTLENRLSDVKMDVIKLDVEGYESVVILGNKEKILKDRPVIFMEYNPVWVEKEGSYKTDEVFNFFLDNQFTIFSRNKNKILSREELDTKNQDNWIVKPIL
jgi:FkbM family methyltransferase